MLYSFKQIQGFLNPDPLFFLCGVEYNKRNPDEDKRVALKKFLTEKGYSSIILEQHFVLGQNDEKPGYKYIQLKNLNDVETLACMLVDGIFILHESFSTAAEIALFASHENVAEKVFVLIPDVDNAGENYLSGFIQLGYKDVIPAPIIFYPITEKHITTEINSKTYTYFNDNQIGMNLRKSIESKISETICEKKLKIQKNKYKEIVTDIISYYFSDNSLCVFIDVHLLKYYIISLFNIPDFRREFRNSAKFFDAVTTCEEWFKKLLINTIQQNEKISIEDFEYKFIISNSVNSRLTLRKAISFILYCFHALGWINLETSESGDVSISKKSDNTVGFKAIYDKYSEIIYGYEPLDLEGILI